MRVVVYLHQKFRFPRVEQFLELRLATASRSQLVRRTPGWSRGDTVFFGTSAPATASTVYVRLPYTPTQGAMKDHNADIER